jgi:hypothetical protein
MSSTPRAMKRPADMSVEDYKFLTNKNNADLVQGVLAQLPSLQDHECRYVANLNENFVAAENCVCMYVYLCVRVHVCVFGNLACRPYQCQATRPATVLSGSARSTSSRRAPSPTFYRSGQEQRQVKFTSLTPSQPKSTAITTNGFISKADKKFRRQSLKRPRPSMQGKGKDDDARTPSRQQFRLNH